MKHRKHRQYFITIMKPLPKWTHDAIRNALGELDLAYWCMADEQRLEDKTPHTHIFFATAGSPIALSTVKRLFPMVYVSPANGTSANCKAYIQKSGKWGEVANDETSIEGTFEEWGKLPNEQPAKQF